MKLAAVALTCAFILFYTVTQPQHAADIVHAGWHVAVNVAHGIGNFINTLVS